MYLLHNYTYFTNFNTMIPLTNYIIYGIHYQHKKIYEYNFKEIFIIQKKIKLNFKRFVNIFDNMDMY